MHRATVAALVLIFVSGLLGACARLPFRSADPVPAQQTGVAAPPPAAQAPTSRSPDASVRTPATSPAPAPSPATSPPPASSIDAIVGPAWHWTGLLSPVEEMDIYASDRYAIRFLPSGRIEVTADCRSGSGTWSAGGEHGIAIGSIELGGAPCPAGSLSERFAAELARSSGWLFGKGGELYLELGEGAGALRFSRLR